MRAMFQSAGSFHQDISGWNTNKVENFDCMFQDAISFDCDLSLIGTSSATSMKQMFQGN